MISDKITREDEIRIIRQMANHNYDKLNMEKLGAMLVHLDKVAKQQKVKRLLVESGSEQLIEDLDHYINKVFFREMQLRKLKKFSKMMLRESFRIARMIPRRRKILRGRFLAHLKRMRCYWKIMLDFIPKEPAE